jgi:hypothetical protein
MKSVADTTFSPPRPVSLIEKISGLSAKNGGYSAFV